MKYTLKGRLLLSKKTRDGIQGCLTGGNHLASPLIGYLGVKPHKFPPYTASIDDARSLVPTDLLDIWIAWKTIMELRDALEQDGLVR